MNIGVFDSGLGGLAILRAIFKKLPQYNYIYYGDNARVPYGNRSAEVIYQFTKEAIDFLIKKKCLLIILACNTSTAISLRRIQNEYLPENYPDRKVLGVIKPAVEKLVEGKFKKIGIIGTKATVNSESYVREIKKLLPKSEIIQEACPLLVPYIEDPAKNKEILHLMLEEYLNPVKENNVEALLLACTHYEIIENEIKNLLGQNIQVISEGKIVAEKLEEYLRNHPEIETKLDKKSSIKFHFSDTGFNIQKLKKLFFNG